MYITADTIIKAAALLTAISALISAIIAVYKVVENNKRQSTEIQKLQEEQRIICQGLRGALQGLLEKGCDGPCRDALEILEKHLNKQAHSSEL
jgi:hypothetical protein